MRTETTINHTYDFGVGRRLKNLPALRQIGFAANRRVLQIEQLTHDCPIGAEAFTQLQQPAAVDGQHASALPFGQARVQALLAAVVLFCLQPEGFRNRQLRPLLARHDLHHPTAIATTGRTGRAPDATAITRFMKTLLFVDDEPNVLQGLQRQLRPLRAEWDMYFVEGGQKALDFLATRPVDIVVSDMMMPGMDGEQLLLEIVKRHPQTIRIILSGHSEREAALRLVGPAHQYLSKPCDANELRQAITRAFALRTLLDNDRLKRLVNRIRTLPTLPASQNQLAEELQKESPSIERVGEIISHDLGMTAKILQIVNSAFFGLGQPVSNVSEAAIYLGLGTIHSLMLSVGIFSQFDQKICKTFSLEALARCSWTTAILARKVARAERQDLKMID